MSERLAPSHQTVRLARGKHDTAADGACVVELASMLAGEPFGDQPRSVCPVIAAYLRAYNDGTDDLSRQVLYGVAARVVGTSAGLEVERARARRCAELTADLNAARSSLRRRLCPQPPLCVRDEALEAAGVHLSRMLLRHRDGGVDRALAVVDELAAIGAPHGAALPFTAGPLGAPPPRTAAG
ncbi:MAG: hypothetical protein H0U33_04535 [Solirubrobacterales bacterium]|nr:hypothetical protein [Solirubrobacterales bacterium]